MNTEIDIKEARRNQWLSNGSPIWVILIAALYVAARVWRLTTSCLWFDEIFSVHAARHGWHDVFYFVAADMIHPPFFYILLKLWMALGGESLVWLRLLPALISCAAIVPFLLLSRELRLKTTDRNLALLLLAVNGYLIKYAQEVRMYSMLFFLAICSLWLLFRWLNREPASTKALAALSVVNFLLIYTHYAGWLLVLLEAFVLLIWHRRKFVRFLLSLGVLLLTYVPWIYEVVKVATTGHSGGGLQENIGWVTRPGILDLVQYFVFLNRPFLFAQSSTDSGFSLVMAVIAFALLGLPILALGWSFLSGHNSTEKVIGQSATVLVLAPVLLAFIFSWLSPYSVWGTRHLIIASTPYAIITAIALNRLRPAWLRVAALSTLGCWFVLSFAVFLFTRSTNFIWCSWEQLAPSVAASERQTAGPVRIYTYEDLVAYHLWFTLNKPPEQRFKISVIKGVAGMPEDPAYFLPRAFSDVSVQRASNLAGENVWIAFRANQWDETRPPLNLVKSNGYRIGRVFGSKAQGQQAFIVQLLKTTN